MGNAFFPVILMEVYIFSLGLGLFLAEAAVFFRDIQYIYNVLTTAWMYLTPIFYPMEQLPESVQKAIKIFNPMYQYITQFRTISLHQTLPAAGRCGIRICDSICLSDCWIMGIYKKTGRFYFIYLGE